MSILPYVRTSEVTATNYYMEYLRGLPGVELNNGLNPYEVQQSIPTEGVLARVQVLPGERQAHFDIMPYAQPQIKHRDAVGAVHTEFTFYGHVQGVIAPSLPNGSGAHTALGRRLSAKDCEKSRLPFVGTQTAVEPAGLAERLSIAQATDLDSATAGDGVITLTRALRAEDLFLFYTSLAAGAGLDATETDRFALEQLELLESMATQVNAAQQKIKADAEAAQRAKAQQEAADRLQRLQGQKGWRGIAFRLLNR